MASLRQLFGGAITMELPSKFIDASDLRQVPDTQEVFLDPDSDVSVIVEILQRVDVEDIDDAVKLHFNSLAHDNGASSQEILEITVPSEPQSVSSLATPRPIVLLGRQTVRKFNSPSLDEVTILVALYRVKVKGIDMVLTTNIPISMEEKLESGEEVLHGAKHMFDNTARSLKIVDFSLFV